MKHLLILFMFAVGFSNASAKGNITNNPDVIAPPIDDVMYDAEYTQSDKEKVEKLLKEAKTNRKEENAIIYFAKQFLGIPYVAHTLESGDEEHLIVNLREMDCTTFVEYVLALAICDKKNKSTFKDFCHTLANIRYKNGKIYNYTSRNHYFTWWAENNENSGLVKDIAPHISATAEAPFTAVQTININYMSTHPNLYKHLKNNKEFVSLISYNEKRTNYKQFRYIPKKALNGKQSSSLGAVKSGDIIALLTDSDGLDTRHIAIAYWQKGKLYFIHASSLYKKVLINKDTLYDYEAKQKKHTGIRVFRMQ